MILRETEDREVGLLVTRDRSQAGKEENYKPTEAFSLWNSSSNIMPFSLH